MLFIVKFMDDRIHDYNAPFEEYLANFKLLVNNKKMVKGISGEYIKQTHF